MPWILKVNKVTKNNAKAYLIAAFQVLMETITVRDTTHLFEQAKKIVAHHHRMNEQKKAPINLNFKVILMTMPDGRERIDLVRVLKLEGKVGLEAVPLLSILNQEIQKGENEFITINKK